jgi:hypothetical protein
MGEFISRTFTATDKAVKPTPYKYQILTVIEHKKINVCAPTI